MRRILPIAGLGLALTASTGLALAQGTSSTGNTGAATTGAATTPTTSTPADRSYSPNNPAPQPERPTNWGWLGLLGLAGLAGLIPRRTVTTPMHTTTTTRP